MSGDGQILLFGFGNPGRGDDGLGPALADAVEALALPGVRVESTYQLQVEDSLEVLLADVVLFADATVAQEAPYRFERVLPDTAASFTTHAVSPAALLGIAQSLRDATPEGYLLTVRGQDFHHFHEGLSSAAERDLAAALRFLIPLLEVHDPAAFRAACHLTRHE